MNRTATNWMGYHPDQLIPRLRGLCTDLEALNKRDASITLDDEPVFIDSWALTNRAVPVLTGFLTGHPHIKDNRVGVTTEIYYFDKQLGLARSLSRWYKVGDEMTEEISTALKEALMKQ